MNNRIEHDALGEVKVPLDAYFGSETMRAVNNFRISGIRVDHDFIKAYVIIKKAAASANAKLGALDHKKSLYIQRACDELLDDKLSDQFPVDVFQAGAGTSTHMNVNEVIANRALELMGAKKGEYNKIHPNDDVNRSQSTNDTYHAAIHITSVMLIKKLLLPSMQKFSDELKRKAVQTNKIIKVGRTHLQDAVPMKLGDQFLGYAGTIDEMIKSLNYATKTLQELPIGGTAVGSELNTPVGYKKLVIANISKITNITFYPEKNIFAGMQNQKEELLLVGILKDIVISINRIANDLRLMSSGPRTGIGEIILPAVQPGSSIMPGKINPSIAEMMNMVCFEVMGCCTTTEHAADAGQLELNVFMPIISYNIIFGIKILSNGLDIFTTQCIRGIKPNIEVIQKHMDENLSVVTALTPFIGYEKAAKIAQEAYRRKMSIKQICLEKKLLNKKMLDRILDPRKQV